MSRRHYRPWPWGTFQPLCPCAKPPGLTETPPPPMSLPLQMSMDTNEVLPSSFNAAHKWPGLIHEPLDQGNCAGSWAFSTAGEMPRS